METVLIVSVHPDDEVLGAGGTLLRHRDAGHRLVWLILTGLHTEYGFTPERIASRNAEIETVATRLGAAAVERLDYPTMQLSSHSVIEMVPRIMDVVQRHKPSTIYTVNRSDAHSDHRHAFDAVIACTKSFRAPFLKRVLMYECVSETEFAPALPEKAFIPNYFVDITPHLREKLDLCGVYVSEMGTHPFPRSLRNLEALATLRGAFAGVEYAEAFQIVKWIDK